MYLSILRLCLIGEMKNKRMERVREMENIKDGEGWAWGYSLYCLIEESES